VSTVRFIIEGEWSGYRSSQQRVVHRQVYASAFKKLRAWADKTHAIRYTDGTALYLTVRDCKPRERVVEIRGYTKLIENCARHDVSSVQALIDLDEKAKAANATGATA
jgi:hypothetical protein